MNEDEADEGFQAFIRLEEALRRLESGLPVLREAIRADAGIVTDGAQKAAGALSKAVQRVEDAAGRVTVAGRRQGLWLAGGIALGLVVAAGGAWWLGNDRAYGRGYVLGREAGLQENRDTEAAASWANTPAGKLAWRMETAAPGTLAALTQCGRPGWTIEDQGKGKPRMCWPRTAPNGLYGWAVP